MFLPLGFLPGHPKSVFIPLVWQSEEMPGLNNGDLGTS
jgi:hypothetical protein